MQCSGGHRQSYESGRHKKLLSSTVVHLGYMVKHCSQALCCVLMGNNSQGILTIELCARGNLLQFYIFIFMS